MCRPYPNPGTLLQAPYSYPEINSFIHYSSQKPNSKLTTLSKVCITLASAPIKMSLQLQISQQKRKFEGRI